MLTRDALAALYASLRERKVLSVYLDGRASDPASRLAWKSVLTNNITALRRQVEERASDELSLLDGCVALVEARLAPITGALSAPGFVLFATEDAIVLTEQLPVAMPNVARWETGPWISPYLRAQKELRPAILAIVDGRSARLYRYVLGSLSPIERLHAHVHADQPIHMGAGPRQSFHPGTRGAPAADAIDRARQHGTRRMMHELIEQILALAPADEWIVLGGTPTRVEVVMALLPASARRRAAVAPRLSAISSTSALRRAASDTARQLRQRLDQETIDTALGRAAEGGCGSCGEDTTTTALRDSAVQTLLLSTRFATAHPEISEELSRLALVGGAAVEIVTGTSADRLDREGGVAATLRFVAPHFSQPADEVVG